MTLEDFPIGKFSTRTSSKLAIHQLITGDIDESWENWQKRFIESCKNVFRRKPYHLDITYHG